VIGSVIEKLTFLAHLWFGDLKSHKITREQWKLSQNLQKEYRRLPPHMDRVHAIQACCYIWTTHVVRKEK
jgi:hypothetical protein